MLGNEIDKDSLAYQIYNTEVIYERHRHRWELNEIYKNKLNKHGLKTSGINPKTKLVEIIEYPKMIGSLGTISSRIQKHC